jgi:hypothetical protein
MTLSSQGRYVTAKPSVAVRYVASGMSHHYAIMAFVVLQGLFEPPAQSYVMHQEYVATMCLSPDPVRFWQWPALAMATASVTSPYSESDAQYLQKPPMVVKLLSRVPYVVESSTSLPRARLSYPTLCNDIVCQCKPPVLWTAFSYLFGI